MATAFNAMLDRLETARREASRTALTAQEAERVRIARELHDEVGQSLTAAVLRAEQAAAAPDEPAKEALTSIAAVLHDSLDEVRRISRELRPEALDDLGLVNALIALCSRIDEQGTLAVRRDLATDLPALSPETELVIYRVAQEALTNTLRHADANTAHLSLRADDELTLTVSDDGSGLPADGSREGVGIAGMQERALLIGGRLAIESKSGEGTVVRLTLPLERR